MDVHRNVIMLSLSLGLVLLATGANAQPLVLTVPAERAVALPSVLDGADDDSVLRKCCTCCPLCCESGATADDADGPLAGDAVTRQLLEIRRVLGPAFTLSGEESPNEPDATAARLANDRAFLAALATVRECADAGDGDAEPCATQQAEVMSVTQATTLRYAADRLEQLAETLQQAESPWRPEMTRQLAENVQVDISAPADPQMATPAGSTILR